MEAGIKAGTWTEEDKKKVVGLLNFIAKNAEFNGIKVAEILEFHGLLSWSQHVLIKKIDSCMLDVVAVHEIEPKKSKSKGKK